MAGNGPQSMTTTQSFASSRDATGAPNRLQYEEILQLEKSFKHLMRVFIKLVIAPTVPKDPQFNWPAMLDLGSIQRFTARNANHAKPPNDPIYRKQSVVQVIQY